MDRAYIERLHIRDYGCIRDVDLKLTPLHALIGPNDSGKSTILRALRTLTTLAAGPLNLAEDAAILFEAAMQSPKQSFRVWFGSQSWRIGSIRGDGSCVESLGDAAETAAWTHHGSNHARNDSTLATAVAGSTLFRLDPDSLRQPADLIPEGAPVRFANALGLGLPAIYDAILSRDLPAYIAINDELRRLFPDVKSLAPRNSNAKQKTIGIQLHDGTTLGANLMSEGMLYYLAYAALRHLDRVAVILIEEPENGLHPARIREVMTVLKEIAKTTQVVLATHSPLVINELEPDQVSVVRRFRDEGTKVTPIQDTPNFARRSEVYALGELWVSYADGELEAPLFEPPQAASDPGEPREWSEESDA